ncbi:MAG: PTS sugar transporter subunit IIA [Lachnospiraceae bacterium]
MLGKLFKRNSGLKVLAPLEGEAVSLTQVNDPTFSEGILGKGMAIRPSGGRVVSPVNGKVTQMFETGHAVTLESAEGIEILIHVGIDTVRLKGEHYTIHARTGDQVKAGELLMEFDNDSIKSAGFDTITPVVVCNTEDFNTVDILNIQFVKELEEIMEIKK